MLFKSERFVQGSSATSSSVAVSGCLRPQDVDIKLTPIKEKVIRSIRSMNILLGQVDLFKIWLFKEFLVLLVISAVVY